MKTGVFKSILMTSIFSLFLFAQKVEAMVYSPIRISV